MNIKVIPGLNGSGPDHWQSLWEKEYGFVRIEQEEWSAPRYSEWEKNLVEALRREKSKDIILIAHSLGCLLTAKAIPKIREYIKAIFLVAPPNTNSDVFPKEINSFNDWPEYALGVPGILVYSENDEYSSPEFSLGLAEKWGLEPVSVGEKGHINSQSGFGSWNEGYEIFEKLLYIS